MLIDMDIPKDFQKTELGLIPKDWKIAEFQEVMTGFFSGATPYRGRPDYYGGKIKWITSGELNYNIITDTCEKITEEAIGNTNLKILPKGTFLIAITGLEAEGTRGSCGITGVEATSNQSCMALFPKEALDNCYLYHFYVWQGKMLAFKYCQGTKQQSYTGKIARTLPIILPPSKFEQTSIATTLSDTDELILNLEKLITKKKNIKQGAMQEILRPKVGWDLKRLGEIAELKNGYAFKSINYDDRGDFYIITIANVQDGFMVDTGCNKICTIPKDIQPHQKLSLGDILISMTGNVGRICKVNVPNSLLNQRVGKLQPIDIDNEFFFQVLNNSAFKNQMIISAQGGAQGNIGKNDILKYKIFLPKDKLEQTRIAEILCDMGNEINVLENKLNKLRMLKRSMMQVLLTGKIRLS